MAADVRHAMLLGCETEPLSRATQRHAVEPGELGFLRHTILSEGPVGSTTTCSGVEGVPLRVNSEEAAWGLWL